MIPNFSFLGEPKAPELLKYRRNARARRGNEYIMYIHFSGMNM